MQLIKYTDLTNIDNATAVTCQIELKSFMEKLQQDINITFIRLTFSYFIKISRNITKSTYN